MLWLLVSNVPWGASIAGFRIVWALGGKTKRHDTVTVQTQLPYKNSKM